MRFHFARFSPAKPFVSNLDIGPAVGAVSATARRRIPMSPTEPVPDTQRLSHGWRVCQQAPSGAVRLGTFHAAGCGLLRVGAFDAAGDWIPVP